MPKAIDLSDKILGKLTVLKKGPKSSDGRTTWICRCECGVVKPIRTKYLVAGTAKTCGCGKVNKKHGKSLTRIYKIWSSMKARCNNKNYRRYADYGGRGIKVCERWSDFNNFHADMGDCPSDTHSLDRIDVNGDYTPENCRWATPKQQANNRRDNVFVDIYGERLTVSQASRKHKVSISVILYRLNRGEAGERLIRPVKKYKLYELNGEKKTLNYWARHYGIRQGSLWNRIDKGDDIQSAISYLLSLKSS